MSLTTHSAGQVSTAAASSLSLSPPSSTPSKDNNTDSAAATSSILFSFLIVFLSVFGTLMVGGILCHYVMARRRQLLRAELEEIEQRRLKRQKPEMWDVWAEPFAPLKSQYKWRSLNPLSVQVADAFPSEDSTHADEALTGATRTLTASLVVQLAYDLILCRPLAIPPSLSGTQTPPTPATKVPAAGTGIHVAVLVAMPSPRHRTELSPDSFKETGARESEGLREYVIGTARSYIQYP